MRDSFRSRIAETDAGGDHPGGWWPLDPQRRCVPALAHAPPCPFSSVPGVSTADERRVARHYAPGIGRGIPGRRRAGPPHRAIRGGRNLPHVAMVDRSTRPRDPRASITAQLAASVVAMMPAYQSNGGPASRVARWQRSPRRCVPALATRPALSSFQRSARVRTADGRASRPQGAASKGDLLRTRNSPRRAGRARAVLTLPMGREPARSMRAVFFFR